MHIKLSNDWKGCLDTKNENPSQNYKENIDQCQGQTKQQINKVYQEHNGFVFNCIMMGKEFKKSWIVGFFIRPFE